MIVDVTKYCSVVQPEGSKLVVVTRPCIMGGVSTHAFETEYDPVYIAGWLHNRLHNSPNMLAQETFPNLSPPDREFLMSGITPHHWEKMFPK